MGIVPPKFPRKSGSDHGFPSVGKRFEDWLHDFEMLGDRSGVAEFRLLPPPTSTPALSPSKRAKQLKISSPSAKGRTKLILAGFGKDRRSGITLPDLGTIRLNRRISRLLNWYPGFGYSDNSRFRQTR